MGQLDVQQNKLQNPIQVLRSEKDVRFGNCNYAPLTSKWSNIGRRSFQITPCHLWLNPQTKKIYVLAITAVASSKMDYVYTYIYSFNDDLFSFQSNPSCMHSVRVWLYTLTCLDGYIAAVRFELAAIRAAGQATSSLSSNPDLCLFSLNQFWLLLQVISSCADGKQKNHPVRRGLPHGFHPAT